jgi:hypothetical protein
MKCKAITKAGTRCKNNAIEGTEYCGIHSKGKARSVKKSPRKAVSKGSAKKKGSKKDSYESYIEKCRVDVLKFDEEKKRKRVEKIKAKSMSDEEGQKICGKYGRPKCRSYCNPKAKKWECY